MGELNICQETDRGREAVAAYSMTMTDIGLVLVLRTSRNGVPEEESRLTIFAADGSGLESFGGVPRCGVDQSISVNKRDKTNRVFLTLSPVWFPFMASGTPVRTLLRKCL